jgi:hypothetical protein
MDRTVTFNKEEISGHESQMGLDTKTDRLTDRQLQCDFHFSLVSSVWESVEKGLQPGGRGIAIVGAVTRKCFYR